MTHMIARALAYAYVFVILIMSGGLVYFSFFEPSVIVYPKEPLKILGPSTKAGEYAWMVTSMCNTSDKTVVLQLRRYLEHQTDPSKGRLLPAVYPAIKPGCSTVTRKSADPIYPDVDPGWYRYVGTASYEGLIQTHTQQWVSEYFEVVR